MCNVPCNPPAEIAEAKKARLVVEAKMSELTSQRKKTAAKYESVEWGETKIVVMESEKRFWPSGVDIGCHDDQGPTICILLICPFSLPRLLFPPL